MALSALCGVAVVAAAAPAPAVGASFCGSVDGAATKLTVLSPTLLTLRSGAVVCPSERFVCSSGRIETAEAGCAAQAVAAMTYDGNGTVAVRGKRGSARLSSAACGAAEQQPAGGAPPPGLYCGSIAGILNSNLTVINATHMTYFNDITVANVLVACPDQPFVFQPDTGLLDISKDMADPTNCFAKASVQDGGSTFTFTFDGLSSITSSNSRWGAIDLQKAGGRC
eukprot:TRINITY_DN31233_c0_g1_i1.p2 TRINITY_DN31233_c0_g1~~TRINITY_DN31233_c0_g1_i1.p2  ORF type:complete len:243 (+),score=91.26 TRINITY_DN31233_c0_g1_i1:55-729(+)